MRKGGHRSNIAKTLGSDFIELLTEVSSMIGPRVDVYCTRDSFFISADLAGAIPGDVKLGLSSGSIVISGEVLPSFDNDENMKVFRQERFTGSFERTIKLPRGCLTEYIQAKMDHGILTIEVPLQQPQHSPESGEEDNDDSHSI